MAVELFDIQLQFKVQSSAVPEPVEGNARRFGKLSDRKVLSSWLLVLSSKKYFFSPLDFVLKKSVLLQSEKIEINFNLNLKNVRNCRNRRATIQSKQR